MQVLISILAAVARLVHQLGVGQHRPRHRDQVGIAAGEHVLGDLRHVDAVAGDHRHAQFAPQPAGDLREGRARHHRGNGRHRRLMPAEMRADDVGTRLLHCLAERDDLVPGQAAVEHVHGRDAEDQDKALAHRRAHAPHHFHRKAHAVFPRAAPAVAAMVGLLHEEGGQQVTGRADDLDTVVAGGLRQGGAAGEVGELLFDAGFVELVRRVAPDARLHRRWRHAVGRAGERTGVQDLQADLHLGVGGVHGLRDQPVGFGLLRRGQLAADAAFVVGRDAAGDDHADAAARPLGKVFGHAREAVRCFFQPGVHRAHQDAVLQLREAQVQRPEDMRVARGGVHREAEVGTRRMLAATVVGACHVGDAGQRPLGYGRARRTRVPAAEADRRPSRLTTLSVMTG